MTLNRIAWRFTKEIYTDLARFNQDVVAYQLAIYQKDSNWEPNAIAVAVPEIQVQYMAWVKEPSDLLENETLIDEDKQVFEEELEEEMHQVEILAKLKANDGEKFTALEFLMKAHNQQANKDLGDHIFFEGTDDTPQIINGLPTYFIACGS
jgi:hypothetical protein